MCPSSSLDTSLLSKKQGGLNITRQEFVRYFGDDLVSRIYLRITSHCPDNWGHNRYLSAGLVFKRMQDKFLHGTITPAIIIDASQGLVAAFSNLDTSGHLRYPAVHIYREKINRIRPQARENDHLAALSLYATDSQSEARQRWRDFHPTLAAALSTNQSACEQLMQHIAPTEWRCLEYALTQLPHNAAIGLHEIELPVPLHRTLIADLSQQATPPTPPPSRI